MASTGCTFFNFGGGCMVRLLVALDSLRQFYAGPVTVFLAKDEWCAKARKDIEKYASVYEFDFHETVEAHIQAKADHVVKRNLKSVIKPQLFRLSPYDHTLMFDGDLLFQASPEPLLAHLVDGKGFLVTQFSSWHTDGSKMSKRVQRAWPHLTKADKRVLQGKLPAVNIGVMGWSKGYEQTIDDWENMTIKLAGQHIADEIACQVTYHRHKHIVVGPEWNDSCFYTASKLDATKILHFHGGKHCGYRPSSWRWLQHLAKMLREGRSSGIRDFLTWSDKSLLAFIKDNPTWEEIIHAVGHVKSPGWKP